MFENLIAQDAVRKALEGDIAAGRVPPAMLFSGPPASGKLTAALETARVLSCKGKAAWGCSCPECARHRSLMHLDLLLLGKRSFPEEIAVAKEFLARSPSPASAYFFLRAMRKLLARFNPVLWTGEESRLGKAAPLVQAIEEALDPLDPEAFAKGYPDGLAAAVESACQDAFALETFVPDAPGVFMIRNAGIWSQLAPSGTRKTVIIENADSLQDSARNAMLKILEEPPQTVRFILLTSRRSAMLATILSRSRLYSFAARDSQATTQVLSKVFKSQEMAPSLQAFFEARMPFPPTQARLHAERFAGRLLADRRTPGTMDGPYAQALVREATGLGKSIRELLEDLGAHTGWFGTKDRSMTGSFIHFLRALMSVFSGLLAESGGNPAVVAQISRWSRMVREAALQYSALNRSPELLVKVLAVSFGEET